MRRALKFMVAMALIPAMTAYAETVGFEQHTPGAVVPGLGWEAGVTGGGSARWEVRRDGCAPSARNVLQQSGTGDFPWIVRRGALIEDGFVEVKFKAIAGKDDQAAGIVWRWKSGDKYYVARANALENNVSLYYTEHGRRNTLRYVDAPVPAKTWHTLRVEFSGRRVVVMLNGKTYIDMEDAHIGGLGRVGMWTKADSVTAFDDFTYGYWKPVRK